VYYTQQAREEDVEKQTDH